MIEAGITLLIDLEPATTGSINNTISFSTFSDNPYGISIDQYLSVSRSFNNTIHHSGKPATTFSLISILSTISRLLKMG